MDLVPLVRDDVYRIAVEALRNAFRHAHAKRIEVEIHYDKRRLRMRIRTMEKASAKKFWIREAAPDIMACQACRNAALVNGKLSILSGPNCGTEVVLTIPAAIA